MATLIMTAKLNDIDPQAWLADVLARIAEAPVRPFGSLLAIIGYRAGCFMSASPTFGKVPTKKQLRG
jgi:hypothetical protein